jgi:hypothetical protein
MYRVPTLSLSLSIPCLFIIHQDHIVLINIIDFLIPASLLRVIYLVSQIHHRRRRRRRHYTARQLKPAYY